jgi:streptogramin lyase
VKRRLGRQFAFAARALPFVAGSLLVPAVLAGCGGGGSTSTAPATPTPTPTPHSHRVEQLKTPKIPPVPVTELASYPLLSLGQGFNFLPGIVWGPDSNVWVSEWAANNIARVTPTGTVTEFPLPTPTAVPADMTIGPDGNVWFSETSADAIANINPTTDVITEYPLDLNVFPVVHGEGPRGIVTGPDGNLWFQSPDSGLIADMSPSGVVLNVYNVPTPGAANTRLTVGPDSNIWFTESGGNKVGKLDIVTGGITEFDVPTPNSYPYGIVTAADGNLWFTEGDANQVARITTSGDITEFQTPTAISGPRYITTTTDGSIWFPEQLNTDICRVDPIKLTFLEYRTDMNGFALLEGITAGQGSMTTWSTDEQNNAVVEFGPGSAKTRVLRGGRLHPVPRLVTWR